MLNSVFRWYIIPLAVLSLNGGCSEEIEVVCIETNTYVIKMIGIEERQEGGGMRRGGG
jgi:hypothetical protein